MVHGQIADLYITELKGILDCISYEVGHKTLIVAKLGFSRKGSARWEW